MMKNKLTYIGMLMLLLTISATYGQGTEGVPRRTPAEQADFEKSVMLSPAKAGTLFDPKMDPAQVPHESLTSWKTAPLAGEGNIEAELIQPEHIKVTPLQTTPGKEQPEGAKPQGKTVNRLDIKGPRTQPEPPASGAATNRRTLDGTRTQPQGEKPKR